MNKKKWAFVIMAIFFASSLVLAQDLVEAAKKEKERRARLKKKSSVVVTNGDLGKKEREATIQISLPEDQTPNAQNAIPQKTQRTIRSTTPSPKKSAPSQQIENIDQMDFSVDKVDQPDQLEARGFRRDYATRVLETTQYVKNPRLALDKPDGQYADIGEFGFLDLEIDVNNGSGDDIAIFAKRKIEGHQNENQNYGVFVEYRGEWEFIEFGGGITSPETFDLGDIQSAKKIRLLFKDYTQSMWTAKPYQQQDVNFTMGIDAVESLHK